LENEFILYGQKERERVGGNLLESLVNFERITIYIYTSVLRVKEL
jgi:hypothetical protein